MQQKLASLLDRFIPLNLRNTAYKRTDALIKLRTIVCVLGISLLIPFLALLAFTILHITTGNDFSVALIATTGILLILIFQHLIFQSYGDIYLTAVAYSANFYISTVTAVYFTGGWNSPCMLLMFCAPILAFLIASKKVALFTLWITLIAGMVFFFLSTQGFVTPQLTPPENMGYIQACIWIMACIILFVFLYTQSIVISYLENNNSNTFKSQNPKRGGLPN